MGEAIAAISQYLDDDRTGARDQMISEIADVIVVLQSLVSRQGIGAILNSRVGEQLSALRLRIDAGEFD